MVKSCFINEIKSRTEDNTLILTDLFSHSFNLIFTDTTFIRCFDTSQHTGNGHPQVTRPNTNSSNEKLTVSVSNKLEEYLRDSADLKRTTTTLHSLCLIIAKPTLLFSPAPNFYFVLSAIIRFSITTSFFLRLLNSSFFNVFLSLWQHRLLTLQMVKREVMSRYKGSFLGLLWSLIIPILMLAIYTFVFSVVFKVRLDQDNSIYDDKTTFALLLFVGLIIYNLFSECLSRAPGLILANVNYVKKIIFPLEILPWVTLGSALFHAGISFLVLMAFLLIAGNSIHWTLILLPVVVLPLLLLIMGLSWLLASIGVFVRDIGQFIGLVLTMMLFMSPIFYPASALPESVRGYIFLNPLTFIIEQTRAVILAGNPPDWGGLAIYYLIATVVAWLGFMWFEKTRKGFADVV